jgi:hypothetical protein
MKAQLITKGPIWAVSAVLLAGLAYSLLAFNAKPVYASSCDCSEALEDAIGFCQTQYHSQVEFFQCPVVINGQDYVRFVCAGNPGVFFTFPCSTF